MTMKVLTYNAAAICRNNLDSMSDDMDIIIEYAIILLYVVKLFCHWCRVDMYNRVSVPHPVVHIFHWNSLLFLPFCCRLLPTDFVTIPFTFIKNIIFSVVQLILTGRDLRMIKCLVTVLARKLHPAVCDDRLWFLQLSEVFEKEIDSVMQSLGYCCGRKYVFNPQVLCCYGKQLCTIARDATYYSYQNRYVSIYPSL